MATAAPQVIRLLDDERDFQNAQWQEPILIGTFYRQNSPLSGETSMAALRTRVREILVANRWLMSRLRSISSAAFGEPSVGCCSSKYYAQLEIEEALTNPEHYIADELNDAVFEAYDKSYTTLAKAMDKYNLKISGEAMGETGNPKNPGLPLSKFIIFQNRAKDRLFIGMCINHIIGDGATMYRLYKMLDLNQPVVSLQAERLPNMSQIINEKLSTSPVDKTGKTMTREEVASDQASAMIPAMLMNSFGNFFRGVKAKGFLYKLNLDYVEQVKQEYTTADSFVSTNDVITSWFAQFMGKKTDNLFLPCDLRGRLEGVHSDLAGNYLTGPAFRNADLATPATVRATLNKFLQPGYKWPAPTYAEYRKFGGAVHTNWCKFYHHVEPEGFTQVQHMPILNNFVWTVGPLTLGMAGVLITYVPNKGEKAVVVVPYQRGVDGCNLKNEPILGEQVMPL